MTTSAPVLRAGAARNRATLIEVAHAAFSKGGLQIGVDEVARQSGVGIATLYRHFPTKDHLIEAVMEREFAEVEAAAKSAQSIDDPLESLEAVLQAVADVQRRNRGFVDATAQQLVRPETTERFRSRFLVLLRPVAERGLEAGHLRGDVSTEDLGVLCRMLSMTRSADEAERFIAVMVRGLSTT
jgi:AcrR family transcriptional regulator